MSDDDDDAIEAAINRAANSNDYPSSDDDDAAEKSLANLDDPDNSTVSAKQAAHLRLCRAVKRGLHKHSASSSSSGVAATATACPTFHLYKTYREVDVGTAWSCEDVHELTFERRPRSIRQEAADSEERHEFLALMRTTTLYRYLVHRAAALQVFMASALPAALSVISLCFKFDETEQRARMTLEMPGGQSLVSGAAKAHVFSGTMFFKTSFLDVPIAWLSAPILLQHGGRHACNHM